MREYWVYLESSQFLENTKRKKLHDARALLDFAGEHEITPNILAAYKVFLLERHPATSVKSMLIAANKYFEFIGNACRVSHKDLSNTAKKSPDSELFEDEYARLLDAAKTFSDDRMYMLIKTLCSAGLQLSELKHVTVKGVYAEELSVLRGKFPNGISAEKAVRRAAKLLLGQTHFGWLGVYNSERKSDGSLQYPEKHGENLRQSGSFAA